MHVHSTLVKTQGSCVSMPNFLQPDTTSAGFNHASVGSQIPESVGFHYVQRSGKDSQLDFHLKYQVHTI